MALLLLLAKDPSSLDVTYYQSPFGGVYSHKAIQILHRHQEHKHNIQWSHSNFRAHCNCLFACVSKALLVYQTSGQHTIFQI